MTFSIGVTAYQIIIFVVIVAAMFIYPPAFAFVVIAAVIWTLTQVFTSGLMTTQLTTIVAAVIVSLILFYTAPALLVIGGIGLVVWYFYQNPAPSAPSSPETPKVLGTTTVPTTPPPVSLPIPPRSSPATRPAKLASVKAPSEPTYESEMHNYHQRQAVVHQERQRLLRSIEIKYPQLDPNHPTFDKRLWQALQLRIAEQFGQGNGPIISIILALEEFEQGRLLYKPITTKQQTPDSQ
jgi:hypothetical protein